MTITQVTDRELELRAEIARLKAAGKPALEALELAQDNLRDHGDNCFLHDEGEYNRCFCGKDSLSNHMQSVAEKLDEALAEESLGTEQPAQPQQAPVARSKAYDMIDRFLRNNLNSDEDYAEYSAALEAVYTSPPAQRKPLTDEWVPVTQSLLNEQHPWLYQPMWIAMKGGVVVQGYYEWRQGRNPDRFITDLGDEWAFNADCVMPMVKPTPPTIEAAHGIKE